MSFRNIDMFHVEFYTFQENFKYLTRLDIFCRIFWRKNVLSRKLTYLYCDGMLRGSPQSGRPYKLFFRSAFLVKTSSSREWLIDCSRRFWRHNSPDYQRWIYCGNCFHGKRAIFSYGSAQNHTLCYFASHRCLLSLPYLSSKQSAFQSSAVAHQTVVDSQK